MMILAEMAGDNSIVYMGQRFEVFETGESDTGLSAGDRVRCLLVPETNQVFILEKIA